MPNTSKPAAQTMTLAVSLALLLTGCAHVWKIATEPLAYPPGNKVNARLLLVLTDDFAQASWQAMISPTDKGVIPIGAELAKQAEHLARSVFAEVTVAKVVPAPDAVGPNVLLVPQVIAFERTQPPTIFGQQTTTISLEWRLKTRAGETLWVDTSKGESTTVMGSNPGKSAATQTRAAIDQVFKSAFQAMTASPEIRNLGK